MLSCAANDVQSHHRAGRPTGQVNSQLTSVNGDGVKLNPITSKLPVSLNRLPVLLKKMVLTCLFANGKHIIQDTAINFVCKFDFITDVASLGFAH